MSGKRYPEEFKIEAVKQVVDRGYSVADNVIANAGAVEVNGLELGFWILITEGWILSGSYVYRRVFVVENKKATLKKPLKGGGKLFL